MRKRQSCSAGHCHACMIKNSGTLEVILQSGKEVAKDEAEMLVLAERKDGSNLDTNSGICTLLNILLKYF